MSTHLRVLKGSAKSRPRREPRGVLYWLYRALVCLTIAPLIGALTGLLGLVTGLLLGEFAAAAVMVIFLTEVFVRMVRARSVQAEEAETWADPWWDPEIDG